MDGNHERTQIMTISEVAKYLGVHNVTVYRLLNNTEIPAFKLHGQWRFKKDLLDEWLVKKIQERKIKK
jgi:excisionase family DNA binding protein